ncbi:hypothetical protein Pelo_9385 [Pelomyxa schiedti]|nr:hypothetical protein Pelo_9385 [Pelomyxa schiedti]
MTSVVVAAVEQPVLGKVSRREEISVSCKDGIQLISTVDSLAFVGVGGCLLALWCPQLCKCKLKNSRIPNPSDSPRPPLSRSNTPATITLTRTPSVSPSPTPTNTPPPSPLPSRARRSGSESCESPGLTVSTSPSLPLCDPPRSAPLPIPVTSKMRQSQNISSSSSSSSSSYSSSYSSLSSSYSSSSSSCSPPKEFCNSQPVLPANTTATQHEEQDSPCPTEPSTTDPQESQLSYQCTCSCSSVELFRLHDTHAAIRSPLIHLWKMNIKGAGFSLVNSIYHMKCVYAGSYGSLLALYPDTGSIKWQVRPKGLRRCSGMDMWPYEDWLILGGSGCVACISCEDGHDIWSTSLPGTFFWNVTLLVRDNIVYAGTYCQAFALDIFTGKILWSQSFLKIKIIAPVTFGWLSVPQNSQFEKCEFLIVGCYGYIYMVDPQTGEVLIEVSLPGTGFHVVSLLVNGPTIYSVCNGVAFAHDMRVQEKLWENKLKGFGVGEGACILEYTLGSHNDPPETPTHIAIGLNGKVASLSALSGEIFWVCSLPNCGYGFVSLGMLRGLLYAVSWGKMYILDPETGKVLFLEALTGTGHGPATIASAGARMDSSACTLFARTDVTGRNSTPADLT